MRRIEGILWPAFFVLVFMTMASSWAYFLIVAHFLLLGDWRIVGIATVGWGFALLVGVGLSEATEELLKKKESSRSRGG